MVSREERLSTERILGEMETAHRKNLHPAFDLSVFKGKHFEPGLTMDATGTWNIPIVALEHEGEFRTYSGDRLDTRYWLIEGHQRYRYLNALHANGEPSREHAVFILTIKSD